MIAPVLALIIVAATLTGAVRPAGAVVQCPAGDDRMLPQGGDGQDLEVVGDCRVGPGTYQYGNVNVFGTEERPARLKFRDADIEFWARSILVENFGSVLAGASANPKKMNANAIGPRAQLTIVLYGKADDPPIECKSPGGICGVDPDVWNSNADPKRPVTSKLPGGVTDFFYNYDFTAHHVGPGGQSRFGSKVLAVSYGGTLRLVGKRGTIGGKRDDDPADSGRSWGRLAGSLVPGASTLVVDGLVDWTEGDHIVVTTTDYMPGHSEELIVESAIANVKAKTTTIAFTNADPGVTGTRWHHFGERYLLSEKAHPGIGDLDLNLKALDTRAAVGLLSRSIRIVSGGDTRGAPFPDESTGYAFGGHTMARQGFKTFQLQGVELHQMGQGGVMGRYPIHFHLTREVPDDTFVKDCSIHDSMTRWITLHGAQNVLLARNVGYKSIGHGFYLESGTEADNRLFSNLGVLARAAIDNPQNPRKVPGILALDADKRPHGFPFHSDAENPTVFWIMNGWNDFRYNMAAGAGTCGACYWLLPGYNSGRENTEDSARGLVRMQWRGYAAMQRGIGRAGMTPLKSFVGNTCTAAMNSFQTVGAIAQCSGVEPLRNPTDKEHLAPIPNPLAPDPGLPDGELYYPRVDNGASRPATRCGDDPKKVPDLDCGDDAKFLKCGSNPSPPWPPVPNRPTTNCMVTVLDRYTTSFNWASTNFAAVWLRQYWFVLSNSAITDVQNGGITFVTGGDYTRSSVIDGFWSVATKSAFVGETQKPGKGLPPANPFASALGPFNPATGLECPINDLAALPPHCIGRDDGVMFEVANFASNQRLFSIYDGPSYQDSNAYLDIEPTRLVGLREQCGPTQSNACPKAVQLYGRGGGVPKDATDSCYLPNAAIGWKQPNGFFYPPAFHSRKLFFDNAEIRHFVIEPEFVPGTLITDQARVEKRYCSYPKTEDQRSGLFNGFTAVDRQTVLNDDDGSLTGLIASFQERGRSTPAERETISVNFDDYFDAPIEALECGSDVANPPADFSPGTAKTSPYDYLTTVVYPACARLNGPPPPEKACGYTSTPPPPDDPGIEPQQNPLWASECSTSTCFGVPLYRQRLRSGEAEGDVQRIQMMGANLWQRSSLTADNGVYYIDTAQSQSESPLKNVFEADRTYYVFLVYAKETTNQTYQLWVGPNQPANFAETNVFPTRVVPNVSHFEFRENPPPPWPSTWKREYDPASGILTVTIDMDFDAFRGEFKRAERDFCLPPSFCELKDGACGCKDDGPDATLCKDSNICGRWAGKDIDWPDGGAYGFGIKFPSNFVPDDANHRPASSCIKKTEPGWNTPLVRVPANVAGDCADTPIPDARFCE